MHRRLAAEKRDAKVLVHVGAKEGMDENSIPDQVRHLIGAQP